MTYQNGEITLSPYTLYWVQMPIIIGEDDRIDLLKRDVFVIECQYAVDEYEKLVEKKDDSSAFFFNLDKILSCTNKQGEIELAKKVAQFISGFCPERSVIHTTTIDSTIKEIFQLEGLIYLEKNFNDKEGSVNLIMNLLKPLFSSENRIRRSDIRLLLYPNVRYKIEAIYDNGNKVICGFLKDISLSGIGIILNSENDIEHFSLKDQITLRLITHNSILKIPMAIVSRKSPKIHEIGVSFTITDTNMIREETANFIVKNIYKWIKDVILTQGKI